MPLGSRVRRMLPLLFAILLPCASASRAPADGELPAPVTLEPAAPAAAAVAVQPLFSVRDSLAELFGSGDAGVVRPLVNRSQTPVRSIRTLSVPNPLSLLGNPLSWRGRLRAGYGSNFNKGSLLYGHLMIDSGVPLGIDTEFNYRQDRHRVLADRRFWNGDVNVVYHLNQIRYVMFRIGAGLNWLTDGTDTDVGFNTTYGFDVRLKKPWYLTTYIDYGTLGSDSLLHWHVSGGVDFGRLELFIGYDFFEVGTRERKNIIAGVGLWY